jgi:hypothetical protein
LSRLAISGIVGEDVSSKKRGIKAEASIFRVFWPWAFPEILGKLTAVISES